MTANDSSDVKSRPGKRYDGDIHATPMGLLYLVFVYFPLIFWENRPKFPGKPVCFK